jgi:hypothetical protein
VKKISSVVFSFSILSFLLMVTTERSAQANDEQSNTAYWFYLGGAIDNSACYNLARKSGYSRSHLGGYVSGLYYSTACFGAYGAEPGSTGKWVYLGATATENDCQNLAEYNHLAQNQFGGYVGSAVDPTACFGAPAMPAIDCRAAGGEPRLPKGDWYDVYVPYVGIPVKKMTAHRNYLSAIVPGRIADIACYSDCMWEHKFHCVDIAGRGPGLIKPWIGQFRGVISVLGPFTEDNLINSF